MKTLNPKVSRRFVYHSGWRLIGCEKYFFKSGWEYRVAKYLEWQMKANLISGWEYEPKLFWFEKIKRGTVTYLPDFRVTNLDATHYWLEVKGYIDRKSLTKIKRFRKYYPKEQLYVLDRNWFIKNSRWIPKEPENEQIIEQMESITKLLPTKD